LSGTPRLIDEALHIHDRLIPRAENDQIALPQQEDSARGTGALKAQPSVMQGDAEVVGRAFGVKVRPEDVEQLFSMASAGRFEREQLDDGGRPALPPHGSGHQVAIDAGLEPPQETNV